MALLFGGLFPVYARPKINFMGGTPRVTGYEYLFTWDFLERLTDVEAFSTHWLNLMFVAVTPFLGLAALVLLLATRRTRSMAYVTLGAIPFILVIAALGGRVTSGQGWFMGPIGIVAGTLLVTGAIVALQRPHREIGFRLCALTGAATLFLALLPITPDPTHPGKQTSAFILIYKTLEVEKVGGIVFVLALTGMAANALAITVFSGRDRRKRAKWVLLLAMVYFVMMLVLPILMTLMLEVPAWSSFVAVVANIGLRVLPSVGLMVYGISGLILMKVPPHEETDTEVFA